MAIKVQPINHVHWIHRDKLTANDYNPNKVSSPELKLIKISILEDGWTQPLVINPDFEIVDGFHRWTISADKDMVAIFGGKVPVVMTRPVDAESQKMSTIRHNRARGVHVVLDMAKIVKGFIDRGMSQEEIMHRLQMEREEVIRLALRTGIPESQIIKDEKFSEAWEV